MTEASRRNMCDKFVSEWFRVINPNRTPALTYSYSYGPMRRNTFLPSGVNICVLFYLSARMCVHLHARIFSRSHDA